MADKKDTKDKRIKKPFRNDDEDVGVETQRVFQRYNKPPLHGDKPKKLVAVKKSSGSDSVEELTDAAGMIGGTSTPRSGLARRRIGESQLGLAVDARSDVNRGHTGAGSDQLQGEPAGATPRKRGASLRLAHAPGTVFAHPYAFQGFDAEGNPTLPVDPAVLSTAFALGAVGTCDQLIAIFVHNIFVGILAAAGAAVCFLVCVGRQCGPIATFPACFVVVPPLLWLYCCARRTTGPGLLFGYHLVHSATGLQPGLCIVVLRYVLELISAAVLLVPWVVFFLPWVGRVGLRVYPRLASIQLGLALMLLIGRLIE